MIKFEKLNEKSSCKRFLNKETISINVKIHVFEFLLYLQDSAKKLTVATVNESLGEGRVFNIYFPPKLFHKRLQSFKTSQQKLLKVKNVLDLDPVCWRTPVIQELVRAGGSGSQGTAWLY